MFNPQPSQPTLRTWFKICTSIGALSLGASSRILLLRREVVDRYGWFSPGQFHEALTWTQVLPGPNFVNLSLFLSAQLFPFVGVLGGLLFLSLPGALMALVAYSLVPQNAAWVDDFMQGAAIASAALVLPLMIGLVPGLKPLSGAEGVSRRQRCIYAAKLLLAIAVGVAQLFGLPLWLVLCMGLVFSVIIEWLA